MKYWGYMAAKLGAIGLVMVPLLTFTRRIFEKWAHAWISTGDLRAEMVWSFTLLFWFLITTGLIALAVIDQKYRCRTCLHRLLMPVERGSWDKAILFDKPKIEYICPYGHGTMNIPQAQLLGPESTQWARHDDDIWKELESMGVGGRER
jgi:hypothetical protein